MNKNKFCYKIKTNLIRERLAKFFFDLLDTFANFEAVCPSSAEVISSEIQNPITIK